MVLVIDVGRQQLQKSLIARYQVGIFECVVILFLNGAAAEPIPRSTEQRRGNRAPGPTVSEDDDVLPHSTSIQLLDDR
jgi:hypothetical protein